MTVDELARGAAALLKDPVFAEAMQRLREREIAAFEQSAPTDTEAREVAHANLRALKAIEQKLRNFGAEPGFRKSKKGAAP